MTATDKTVRRAPVWIVGTVAGFFGLLYAFAVWNGVGQLISTVQAGVELTPTLWAMWLLTIALPIAIFAVVLVIAKRRVGVLALMLLAGLGVVGAFWLNVLGYVVYLNFQALFAA